MLNEKNERELAYLVKIDNITSITGYDRVELAHIGGWTVVVGKNEFKAGDIAVYFEIDSQVPEVAPFTEMPFLVKKHFKIKTQKMCKSVSQGMLVAIESFGWNIESAQFAGGAQYVVDNEGNQHFVDGESRFLTKTLGVIYAIPEDNIRKAGSMDKYKKMAQRHGKLFKYQPFRWLMKRTWGKKFLFAIFGKRRDKRTGWPAWVVKTDEERIENLPFLFDEKNTQWIPTEKIDGTSTTFTIKRPKYSFMKPEFYVCSRNVCFDKPDKIGFYDTNVYREMAEKYDIENVLRCLLESYSDAEWITIQGETYGNGIQKRDYHMTEGEHDFAAFNLIISNRGRFNPVEMTRILSGYGVPCVPVLENSFTLPENIDELRKYVEGTKSKIDGDVREGVVFRSLDGSRSFKCVSPAFLLEYHG